MSITPCVLGFVCDVCLWRPRLLPFVPPPPSLPFHSFKYTTTSSLFLLRHRDSSPLLRCCFPVHPPLARPSSLAPGASCTAYRRRPWRTVRRRGRRRGGRGTSTGGTGRRCAAGTAACSPPPSFLVSTHAPPLSFLSCFLAFFLSRFFWNPQGRWISPELIKIDHIIALLQLASYHQQQQHASTKERKLE